MNASPRGPSFRSAERGAALVIGLILLLVLTVLAVAGMNSVSMEYVMAGNEQFRSNAFSAAEAGIEQGLQVGIFNPGSPVQTLTAAMVNAPADSYTAKISPQLGGAPQPGWGSTANTFSSYHFEIQSTGTSVRGAQAINVQGMAVISPYDPTVQPDPNGGTTKFN